MRRPVGEALRDIHQALDAEEFAGAIGRLGDAVRVEEEHFAGQEREAVLGEDAILNDAERRIAGAPDQTRSTIRGGDDGLAVAGVDEVDGPGGTHQARRRAR